jgi:hypothetical protein
VVGSSNSSTSFMVMYSRLRIEGDMKELPLLILPMKRGFASFF